MPGSSAAEGTTVVMVVAPPAESAAAAASTIGTERMRVNMGAPRLLRRMLQEPRIQLGRCVGLVPGVVLDAGVLGVLGIAARVLERLDHGPRFLDADGLVGVAVEAPAGDVLELGRGLRIAAAADGRDGGPAFRMGGGEAPGAEAAHRQAGEVDAFLVGLVVLLDFVEDGEGAFAVIAARPPALGLGLREDGDEGEFLLGITDVLGEAALDLLLAVVAGRAGAVQEQDYGIFLIAFVIGRDEEDVLRFAVRAFVDLVDEAGLGVAGMGADDGDEPEQRCDDDDAFHGISLHLPLAALRSHGGAGTLALRRER